MSGLQAKSKLKQEEEDAKLARELKRKEDDRKGIQQKADIAKDLLESKQKHELEKAEARQRLVNSLKGQSVGSIMALAAAGAGRALTDAESASIAKIESGEDEARVKLLTDFLEKNDARDERLLAFTNQSNAARTIAEEKVEEALLSDLSTLRTEIIRGKLPNMWCWFLIGALLVGTLIEQIVQYESQYLPISL